MNKQGGPKHGSACATDVLHEASKHHGIAIIYWQKGLKPGKCPSSRYSWRVWITPNIAVTMAPTCAQGEGLSC